MSNVKADQVPLEPTSLKDIKAKIKANKDGEPIQLPSGLVFRLTKPSISRLMKESAFPSELVAAAIKLDSNDMKPASRDEYLQYLKVIDTVVMRSAVEPRIVEKEEDVDDSSIAINDLDDSDRIAIYLFAQTGVKPLNSFRSEQPDKDSGLGMPKVPRP